MVGDIYLFSALTVAIGLAIFLSLPIVLNRRATGGRTLVLLNAGAIGILAFLLADIFSDVAPLIASSTTTYLTDPTLDLVFLAGVALAFGLLTVFEGRPAGRRAPSPETDGVESAWRLSLIIALGIGFQNLTEGLIFGAAWSAGQIGLLSVVFVGFFLQNITEGFPIVSPLLGRADTSAQRRRLSGLFLIGGVPTIAGGFIGYGFSSVPLLIFFDALAMGAILYVLLPMIRGALRPQATPEATRYRARLVYWGILVGFLVGFLVNAI
ncbi:MAG: ZIP family metal transporter [Thermoplasmata archaeon]